MQARFHLQAVQSLNPPIPQSLNSVTRSSARLRILATAILFSTGGAGIKLAHFTPWQVAGLRSGIAAIAVLFLVPQARRVESKATLGKAAMVGVAYGATLILFVLSTRYTTAANAIYLQAVAPIYILLLGHWLLHEKIVPRDFGFVAVMGLGMACFFVGAPVATATAPQPALGNILGAVSGITYAFLIVGLRSIGKQGGVGALAVVIGNIFAFLAALPMALPLGSHPFTDWLVLLYLGVFQIALSYSLLAGAITHVPAFEASLLLLLEPVLNPVWAWLMLGERPSALAGVGAALILAAMLVRSWWERGDSGAVAEEIVAG